MADIHSMDMLTLRKAIADADTNAATYSRETSHYSDSGFSMAGLSCSHQGLLSSASRMLRREFYRRIDTQGEAALSAFLLVSPTHGTVPTEHGWIENCPEDSYHEHHHPDYPDVYIRTRDYGKAATWYSPRGPFISRP
jgi:hypothetical protein